ncbi:amidase signature domain-containing protein [Xylaria venustula]|nr:amidase signature domain-containing protein [Xylaria venustula]
MTAIAHTRDAAREEVVTNLDYSPPFGYARAKLIAELLIDTAVRRFGSQLPATIIRVGQCAGAIRRPGLWNPREWFSSLVLSSLHLRYIPDNLGLLNSVDFVPIDMLGDIMVDLAMATTPHCTNATTKVFNLRNPHPTEWPELLPAVVGAAATTGRPPLRVVSPAVWLSKLRESADAGGDGAAANKNPGVKLVNFFDVLWTASGQAVGSPMIIERALAASPSLPYVYLQTLSIYQSNMACTSLSFPRVDGIPYLVHPQPLAKVAVPSTHSHPIPVVLLTIGNGISSVQKASTLIRSFASADDVYSPSFANTIILQPNVGNDADQLFHDFQSSGCFAACYLILQKPGVNALPPGPYFLYRGSIHQAYRLYSALSSIDPRGLWKHVAVPSRLYGEQSADKPLAGARMGIKDIFRLEGTQLTMMSRPWTELYGPEEESAEYTKKLIQLGAVIVGKTKMTSFASPEEPTDQWIDFHCPVNPRGDRYQSPSSSSTGAGTSLAGYDWLDFSIAGDSAGSVRAPAPCSGLFSLRPSFDSTSMQGIPANSPYGNH